MAIAKNLLIIFFLVSLESARGSRNLRKQLCVFESSDSSFTCSTFDNDIHVPDVLIGDSKLQISKIEFKPATPIEFSTKTIMLAADFTNYISSNCSVQLSDFTSFDHALNPLDRVLPENSISYHTLRVQDSRLKFETKNVDFISDCNIDRNDLTRNHIFYNFKEIHLSNLQFSSLCPLVFDKVDLKELTVDKLTDKNKPSFVELPESQKVPKRRLDAKISRLAVTNAELTSLNAQTLDPQVFEKLTEFSYVEPNLQTAKTSAKLFPNFSQDLFSPLTSLKQVHLALNNFDLFFRNATLTWLTVGLNANNRVKETTLVLEDLSQRYEFPDEDFCLFRNFPHARNIFPVIRSREKLTCTCTLQSLLQNWVKYSDKNLIATTSVAHCLSDEIYNSTCAELEESCKEPTTTTTATVVTRTKPFSVTLETNIARPNKGPANTDSAVTVMTCIFGAFGFIVGVSLLGIFFHAYFLNHHRRATATIRETSDDLVNIIRRK